MTVTALSVPGAHRIDPRPVRDVRGRLTEVLRVSELAAATGSGFTVAQSLISVSARGVLRGVHATAGQAKVVTCVRGSVLDAVVDVRAGSPTFGAVDTLVLDAEHGTAVHLEAGLGHAFLALTDDAWVSYLCSTEYVPGAMVEVQALDPELGIPWGPTGPVSRSAKDEAAPTLAECLAAGLLPRWG